MEGLSRALRPAASPRAGSERATEAALELVDYLGEAYPGMRDEAGVAALLTSLGFTEVSGERLTPADWFVDYYDPLRARCRELGPGAEEPLASVIAEAEREIAFFESHHDCYGYTFFVARKE